MAAPARRSSTDILLGLAGLVPVAVTVALVGVLGPGLGGSSGAPLGSLVLGSALVAVLAVALAAPLGLIAAIHVVEFADDRSRRVIEPLFAVFAVIPSVVWVHVALTAVPEAGASAGLAAVVLAAAVTPTIALGCIAALDAVPLELREGAWALGAGRAQAVLTIVVPSAGRGLAAALVLGLIRVLAELVIVALLSGRALVSSLDPRVAVETLAGFVAHLAAADPTPADEAELVAVAASLALITVGLGLLRHGLLARRPR